MARTNGTLQVLSSGALLVFLGLFSISLFAAKSYVSPQQPRHAIQLPGGKHGIGFDSIRYIPSLNVVAVPAAGTGDLDLINPKTDAVSVINNVARGTHSPHGEDRGDTSVAYGDGYLFTNDHGRSGVTIINASTRKVVGRHRLQGDADFVRYLPSRHEVWTTELHRHQIEILKFSRKPSPSLHHVADISIPGGPEGLVFDLKHNVAYTNLRSSATVAVSLSQRQVRAVWPDSCAKSRGIVLHGHYLYVACRGGRIVTLNTRDGEKVSQATVLGQGVDLIGYNPHLKHLYAPSATHRSLTVYKSRSRGRLKRIDVYHTASQATCVTSNGQSKVFVCDPKKGQILVYRDHGAGGRGAG